MAKREDVNFFTNKKQRNRVCHDKDIIIRELLSNLCVENALLMPCLNGPEIKIIKDNGTLPKNIFLVERDPEVFKAMQSSVYLKGTFKTSGPMSATDGLNEIAAELITTDRKLDLVYLDFYSQPSAEHVDILLKLFKLNILANNCTMILTFGDFSRHKYTNTFNGCLGEDFEEVIRRYLTATLKKCGYKNPRIATTVPYTSKLGNNRRVTYVTLIVKWKGTNHGREQRSSRQSVGNDVVKKRRGIC